MIKIISFLSLTFFAISCTSDNIVTKEREEFYGIFKSLAKRNFSGQPKSSPAVVKRKTKSWLSKFKQPIILVSSIDHKNQATLIALGNNDEKLTWVSADGISMTFDKGILISTRGYSQDLFSLRYKNPSELFMHNKLTYKKVHRYLDGENKYNDLNFQCSAIKIPSREVQILDYKLTVDRFIENCKGKRYNYKNEYDLLAGTSIVIISKQWISPINQYFLTYNMYAFQKT